MNEIAIEKDVIILTTKTVEILLNENPDALVLYLFYYKNAKIQETNQVYSTNGFCIKGLGWGNRKFQQAKKVLENFKLIEQIKKIDSETGKVEAWYVRINYIWKKTTGVVSTGVDYPQGGFRKTNALSKRREMLKVKEEIYTQEKDILDLWNSKSIKVHKHSERIYKNITKCLKKFSFEEIELGISHYAEVLHSSDTIFSYKWTLEEFLSRQNALPVFLDKTVEDYKISKPKTDYVYQNKDKKSTYEDKLKAKQK